MPINTMSITYTEVMLPAPTVYVGAYYEAILVNLAWVTGSISLLSSIGESECVVEFTISIADAFGCPIF